MEYIVKKITNSFMSSKTINSDNRDVFEFGLIIALQVLFSTIGLVIIGFLLGYVIETIIFLITFSAIRVNAGGRHAKTVIRCFAISTTILVTSLYCVNFLSFHRYLYFLMLLFSNVIIVLYSPVDSSEKPLSDKLKVLCRKRSLITISIIDCIILVCMSLNINNIYINISIFSMFMQCILMLPILNNGRRDHDE